MVARDSLGSSRWLPDGAKDLPPEEALAFRRVERAMCGVMRSWGFEEVIPSSVQFYADPYPSGEGVERRVYSFPDGKGRLLALRCEMTGPVARMMSSRLGGFPAKVFYSGNVFRIEDDNSGLLNEFCQIGAEIIGDPQPVADAESIALCGACLMEAGVSEFVVGVGDVTVTNRFLEAGGLSEGLLKKALVALKRRDMVEFERVICGSREAMSRLRRVMRPMPADGSEARALLSEPGLERLAQVVRAVKTFSPGITLYVDLSIVRNMSYYTGTVFEVYGKGLGRPIGGGGRYDHLLSRYGVDAPATGFALTVQDVVSLVSARQPAANETTGVLVAAAEGMFETGVRVADSLRRRGFKVRFEAVACSREGAAEMAQGLGFDEVVYVTRDGCEELSLTMPRRHVRPVALSGSAAGIH